MLNFGTWNLELDDHFDDILPNMSKSGVWSMWRMIELP